MDRVVNIAIASVGGQGGLTLSRVLAASAIADGYSVRTGETLGMAQRFGSVVSYVRIGKKVLSPTFSPGEADYLIGLELLETIRALALLRVGGTVIASDIVKPPVFASLSRTSFSRDELVEAIGSYAKTLVVPASSIAVKVGNPRAVNMVLLGVFQGITKLITYNSVRRAIQEVVSPRWAESSLKAYEEGLKFAQQV